MDLLLWPHDAAGYLALTVVAWATIVIAAVVAARLEERATVAERPRQRGPAQPFTSAGIVAAGSTFA
jgi:hypothetical protein